MTVVGTTKQNKAQGFKVRNQALLRNAMFLRLQHCQELSGGDLMSASAAFSQNRIDAHSHLKGHVGCS